MKEFKVMRKRRRRRVSDRARKRNRVLLLVAMTLCAVILVGGVCTVCIKYLSVSDDTPKQTETQPCVIENEQTTSLIVENGDISILTVSASEKAYDTLEFNSSDSEVVSVDSGGRIDAKKEGQATITCSGKDFYGECIVTVKKNSEESPSGVYSTAIVANSDIVTKNKQDNSQSLYSIIVNRRTNTVTVYTYDENGDYVVPVRAMVCSCGEFTDENITPTGEYAVYSKDRWLGLFGDVYGQYVTGFSGHYLFHSVPYLKTTPNSLKTDEFNKLGTNASQGCVRLMVADAKWIYDNVDIYTTVTVVDDDESKDPLGTPPTVKVPKDIKWDPTDESKKNPYHDLYPTIEGADDVTIAKDSDFDSKVTAKDTCSNDITDRLTVVGNVVTTKAGQYKVTYSVTDDLGKTATKTITVTVE